MDIISSLKCFVGYIDRYLIVGLQKITTSEEETAALIAKVIGRAGSMIRIYSHSLTEGAFTYDVVVEALGRVVSHGVKIEILHDAPRAYPARNIQILLNRQECPDYLQIRVLPAGRQDGRHFLLAERDIVREIQKDANGNVISAGHTTVRTMRELETDRARFDTLWNIAKDA